jgi:hypothetical protein
VTAGAFRQMSAAKFILELGPAAAIADLTPHCTSFMTILEGKDVNSPCARVFVTVDRNMAVVALLLLLLLPLPVR